MGMSGISKSSVSKLCEDIDERVNAFLKRPLAGGWPYLWLDATYLKVREGGRIVSVAVIVAVAVTIDGRREIVGLHIGPSEAEVFWTDFLRDLVKRGLAGVRLVISDAHEGLKAAIRRVLGATWQRCRVHWTRNALAYVPRTQQTMVAAGLRQAFQQPDQATARASLHHLGDQLHNRWPKLKGFIDESVEDVLAYLSFPVQHRAKLHSTNPLERLNKELKRRADVVGSRASLSTPQRGEHRPADGRGAVGGQRRVAAPTPLHASRRHGRTGHADGRRPNPRDRTAGGLNDDHRQLHPKFHHVDGRHRMREGRAGRRTLKRSILFNTLLRSKSGEKPGLLELALRQSGQLVEKGQPLNEVFYSVRSAARPRLHLTARSGRPPAPACCSGPEWLAGRLRRLEPETGTIRSEQSSASPAPDFAELRSTPARPHVVDACIGHDDESRGALPGDSERSNGNVGCSDCSDPGCRRSERPDGAQMLGVPTVPTGFDNPECDAGEGCAVVSVRQAPIAHGGGHRKGQRIHRARPEQRP